MTFEARTFAYADPPYIGAARYVSYDHPDAARWNDLAPHLDLMDELDEAYDGWALSAGQRQLSALLRKADVLGARMAVWVKPFAAFKANVPVAYSWEPLIFKRALPRREGDPLSRDHLAEKIILQTGLQGAKPERFFRWVLDLIGYQAGDLLVDLFPGTGAMGRAAAQDTLPVR